MFDEARTFSTFTCRKLDEDLFQRVQSVMQWGPTSQNQQSGRFLVVASPEGKARLRPALWEANVSKMESAAATVIFAYDINFHETLAELFPHRPEARNRFDDNEDLRLREAFRNGTLQAGYFMMAARALGVDIGPMSGFDNDKVDNEFFEGSSWRSNFLCNFGYGDHTSLFGRLPRVSQSDVLKFA